MSGCYILYFLQVSYIDCIVQHISTGCCQIYRVAVSLFQTTVNMRNLLATIAEAFVRQRNLFLILCYTCRSNGHSAIFDGGIAHLDRTCIGQIKILSKLDFHYAGSAINIDADVFFSQLLLVCTTLDVQALVEFLKKDVLLFFRNGRSGLAINGFLFGLGSLVVIAGILLAVIQSSDELDGSFGDVPVFQPVEFIGRALSVRICRVRRQIRIFIFQISDAMADGVEDIGRRLARLFEQSHIAAHILAHAQDYLALVVGAVVLDHGHRSPIDFHGFFHGVRIFGSRSRPELGHAVYYQTAAFVLFLLAQDHILAQGYIIVGLAVLSGADHFQVAALDGVPVGHCLLAAHTHRGMFGRHGADRFQLSQVHGIRIFTACCHTGNLTGGGAAVAYSDGAGIGHPGRGGLGGGSAGSRIIASDTRGPVGYGVAAQGDAVCQGGFRPAADGCCILGIRFYRAAQCGQGVLGSCCGVFTESQRIFTAGRGITAKSRSTFFAGHRPFPKGRGIDAAGYGTYFGRSPIPLNNFVSATPGRSVQSSGLVLIAKGCGSCFGSNAFIAKGRSIVGAGNGPFSKSQGTAAGGLRPIAESYGILPQKITLVIFLSRTGLGIFPKGQGTFGNSLGSFPKGYRSDATGSIPFLFFIISATKGQ